MEFVRNIPAHLDKHCGNKNLIPLKDAGIRNVGTKLGGAVIVSYKSFGRDGDNLVIVQFALDRSPAKGANAERCTTRLG